MISPFLGNANNSVQFDECPCPAIACVVKIYCYNPQAVDPDNDSLSYELTAPFGADCLPMGIQATYLFPNDVAGGTLNIDATTGTVCWDSPGMIGEFNFTIKITEWRNGVGKELNAALKTKRMADIFFKRDMFLEKAMSFMGSDRMNRAVNCKPIFTNKGK